jgi:hypothetical protein
MQETEIYDADILVFRPKQPSDHIDVYLRALVDDLKILWKREEFTMHSMLFTTINDNPTHCNLSGQSKRKVQLAHTA